MALLTQDYPPAPGGMNVAQAAQEIDDTEARYLQDILLDFAGLARRRGPVKALSTVSALPRPATNFASTIDPAGTTRFAALTGTAANGYLTVWDSALAVTSDIPWAFALPTDPVGAAATAYRLSSVTPALNGGSFIGTASDYGTSVGGANQALALWRGGVNADYSTGTITFTRGSTAVTGAGTGWSSSNVSPGMFLFANTDDASAGTFTATYIGTVYSVGGGGSITLEKAAPYSGSAGRTYTLTSLRGTTPKVVKGRITCDTASTTVSGGNSKFASQTLGTGTWNIYRQRDFAWVGKVSSVASDISLTLAANAAIAMADELYTAIRGDWAAADKSTDISGATSKLGWLTAVYAERQWYAANNTSFDKTYRLWFSDTGDVEAVDISDDGDWIPIASTTDAPEAIRALVPTYNALLVLKDTESFAVYGSSPDSFSAKKLEDDGTLSTMSVQSYGGGAIWAGRNGIYFYDGVQNTNLTLGKFGPVWENTIRTFDPTRYRMWSMMVRNHYFLHIEKITPTINITKGNTVTTPNHWTVCLNMETRAFTLLRNVGIRGAVQLPASSGRGMWYLVNDIVSGTGKVCDSTDLFDSEGVDTMITTQGGGTPIRTNMVANPSAETNATGVTTFLGATVTRDNTRAVNGSWSFKTTLGSTYVYDGPPATLDANYGYWDLRPVLTGATAGRIFSLSLQIYLQAGTYNLNPYIEERGGAQPTANVSSVSYPVTYTSAGWHTLTATGAVVQNDRTALAVGVYVEQLVPTGIPFTTTYWIDSIQCEEATAPTAYFDGTFPLASWTGTAHGSTSTRYAGGPDFYYETKKFNAGEDIRLKRIKQISAHYLAQGGNILVDTVIGLNDVGSTLTGNFPASVYTWDTLRLAFAKWSNLSTQYSSWDAITQGVFVPKRIHFMKKGHHIAFRYYQSSSSMVRLRMGPQQLGYKAMRPGRV